MNAICRGKKKIAPSTELLTRDGVQSLVRIRIVPKLPTVIIIIIIINTTDCSCNEILYGYHSKQTKRDKVRNTERRG